MVSKLIDDAVQHCNNVGHEGKTYACPDCLGRLIDETTKRILDEARMTPRSHTSPETDIPTLDHKREGLAGRQIQAWAECVEANKKLRADLSASRASEATLRDLLKQKEADENNLY